MNFLLLGVIALAVLVSSFASDFLKEDNVYDLPDFLDLAFKHSPSHQNPWFDTTDIITYSDLEHKFPQESASLLPEIHHGFSLETSMAYFQIDEFTKVNCGGIMNFTMTYAQGVCLHGISKSTMETMSFKFTTIDLTNNIIKLTISRWYNTSCSGMNETITSSYNTDVCMNNQKHSATNSRYETTWDAIIYR